jgi:hypothetical protein
VPVTARTCASIPARFAVARSDGSVSQDGHFKPPHLLSSRGEERDNVSAQEVPGAKERSYFFRARLAETAREGFLDFASRFQPLSSPDRNIFFARNQRILRNGR